MKVLIALNNDAISEAIGNYYQTEYNQTLEMKNVYYFKALLEEMKLNTYDRILIHEELEPFATNNQEIIDNNLFSFIDKISDEGYEANIIFICSDRRKRDDRLVKKMFNIGVYNILIGEDKTVEEVAKLINTPRKKKDAKSYIDYDLEEDAYKKEEEVNETELNRILMAYENAGSDEQRYIQIFERIAEQYTDVQLRVISSFLPEYVRRILMQNCEKYRSLSSVSVPPTMMNQNLPTFQDVEVKLSKRSDGVGGNQGGQYGSSEQACNYRESEKNVEVEQKERIPYTQDQKHGRELPVTSFTDTPAKLHKVTEVIEKEIIREVYETPKDYRKVVCFVGSHKTGTTFIINAVAAFLTRRGIKTAIVDVTKNKDSYFVYAINNEANREIAAKSLTSLAQGKNCPLEMNRISLYTGIPGQINNENMDCMKTIEMAKNKHSVVLVDCDFDTPLEYFKISQNVYIVQDMDILSLQPVTTFLRELKYRGINLEKSKVIINKHLKCGLPVKRIIEGISYYSNPEMTIYDELFEKTISYYILPFDEHNYRKYIEGLYLCKVNYNEFTEDFKEALEHLVSSIYPIGPSKGKMKNFKNIFSSIKDIMSIKKKSSEDDSEFDKITM